MKGFNFEKNLEHQTHAVESTVKVFENITIENIQNTDKNFINPKIEFLKTIHYMQNIKNIQKDNSIDENIKSDKNSNIIDIMMETGTGKTYTYTKTIFELNKKYGIFKFIIIVPTLSIKAGTINFLKSDSSREHFKEQYGKILNLHIIESQKNNRNKKNSIPHAVISFSESQYDKNSIQVMIINAGMLNSETMQKSTDRNIFNEYTIPFDAIGATNPFTIIDEPHKFGKENKTWENIKKLNSQFILRYGATFPDKELEKKDLLSGKKEKIKVKDYHNLIYTLTAVDSFNRNLVKGVIGHITKFEHGENIIVKFIDSDGIEAKFELIENDTHKTVIITKHESLKKIHDEMTDLTIENLNKSTVVLSNGLEMRKGDKINPYSYSETLQEIMIQKAIKCHFEIEKQLLKKDVKIKPLTLFFIDNKKEKYRSNDCYISKTVEQYIKLEIEELLKTENDIFYKSYLKKTLENISLTHGGYFSKDNTEKDESIKKEINEILHDKQAILSLENPRRFIFSHWALREGWDNPNVFQICKLRSSGSEISKLQEVGRGLRLPVNEYGNRVKEEQFYLNYFVDFTENDFVDRLINEINNKSGAVSIEEIHTNLNDNLIKIILEKYPEKFSNSEQLLEYLDEKEILKRNNDFKEGGYEFIKQNYPLIFEGINSNKVRKATDIKKKITIRTEKYQELKTLWEKLNEKVILEYKFENEEKFKVLFTEFLKKEHNKLKSSTIKDETLKIEIKDNKAFYTKSESTSNIYNQNISTMRYSDFIKELSKKLYINLKTVHESIIKSEININNYLNERTLRALKESFNNFLMENAFGKYKIEYKKVSNKIHPTKFTDEKGSILEHISNDIGIFYSENKVSEKYFFNDLYYDSELEKINIQENIEEVIVFTKIPKNSIKIPVAGGKSYSPDFAYVIKFKNGSKKLNFIVETKNVTNENQLRNEENYKIEHAKEFFGKDIEIKFKTQFSNEKIINLINEINK